AGLVSLRDVVVGAEECPDAVLLAGVRERAPVLPGHAFLPLDHEREPHGASVSVFIRHGSGTIGTVTNLRLTKQLAGLAEPLDDLADPVQEAVNSVPQPVRDVLDGVWFGNPLHPALTDVPLGAWTAAFALDFVGSESADGALAVGILGAVPAALTGLNDWSHLRDDARRIGTVHALVNSAGLTLNVLSLAARRGGMRNLGRLLSMTAYGGALFSAHLGGHLSFGLGVRVNRTAFESPRDRYAPVCDESELNGGKLVGVELEGE